MIKSPCPEEAFYFQLFYSGCLSTRLLTKNVLNPVVRLRPANKPIYVDFTRGASQLLVSTTRRGGGGLVRVGINSRIYNDLSIDWLSLQRQMDCLSTRRTTETHLPVVPEKLTSPQSTHRRNFEETIYLIPGNGYY